MPGSMHVWKILAITAHWIAMAPVRPAPIREPWGTIVLVVLTVFGGGVLAWVVLRLGWVLWERWTARRRRRG